MLPRNINYSDSVALVASQIAKAAAGTIFSLTGVNTGASDQYIQIHNSATLPADTAVPMIVFAVAAGENFFYDLGDLGRYCLNGIVVCNSSTCATKTIASADCFFNIQYN